MLCPLPTCRRHTGPRTREIATASMAVSYRGLVEHPIGVQDVSAQLMIAQISKPSPTMVSLGWNAYLPSELSLIDSDARLLRCLIALSMRSSFT
jgi:hypothetical protein